MNWITLNETSQINEIENASGISVIYKHSPRCVVSMMAYRRLKSEFPNFNQLEIPVYIVDVVNNRTESQSIANQFNIRHESPQLLVIKEGQCIYNASHEDVSFEPLSTLAGASAE
tara:strand:+ start:64 stop:408 length:345 start_codon:yes stop_codon:yes gene_type:complete